MTVLICNKWCSTPFALNGVAYHLLWQTLVAFLDCVITKAPWAAALPETRATTAWKPPQEAALTSQPWRGYHGSTASPLRKPVTFRHWNRTRPTTGTGMALPTPRCNCLRVAFFSPRRLVLYFSFLNLMMLFLKPCSRSISLVFMKRRCLER